MKVPIEVLQAAEKVSQWFEERNVKNWELLDCASRAQLKATQDELEQVTHARDVLHGSYVRHLDELENSNRDKRALADKLERYIESTKKQKYDLRTELEAVKAERDGWYRDYQSEFKERIEQLQSATDKGFNDGLDAALQQMCYTSDIKKLTIRIVSLKRKEVTG